MDEELASPCPECDGTTDNICKACDVCKDCCQCLHCARCGDVAENICETCERGDCCCSCETCTYRHPPHRVESTCSNCQYCSDHCECYVCNGCGERVNNTCGDCDRCDDCSCNCSSDAPRFRGHFTYLGEPTKAMPRYTSLELEYASCSDGSYVVDCARQWEDFVVEDGSLPEEGFEINTNPTRGDMFASHIKATIAACNRAETETSKDCGLHVHVDARDLNYHDICKLALLYSKVECALFAMQPLTRQNNQYCRMVDNYYQLQPNGFKHAFLNHLYRNENTFPKTKKEKRAYIGMKNGKRVFSQRTEKYHSARYYAMNLHTWFYRGTVEFRHAASTLSGTKATNWGLVCMWIVEKASTMSYAQIKALSEDSTLALQSILPAELADWVTLRQGEVRRR